MREYTLARIAYDGYCFATDFKSLISGEDLPTFDNLSQEIKDAWWRAARDVEQYLNNKRY